MIKYLIIDDEPIAHEIIEDYASHLTQLRLEKNCYNVFEAIEYLSNQSIDLIFLDINMPKVNGFQFLKSLKNPPKTIVTTAYKEYAIEGYELDVVDYLLKPFSLDRFLKAIQKATIGTQSNLSDGHNQNQAQLKIFLKDGKKLHQVAIDHILYVEAFGNYTKVVTRDKTVMTLEKLSSYFERLPQNEFIQVHKSFIISVSKIEVIENNKIIIADKHIPIGQTYKNNLKDILK